MRIFDCTTFYSEHLMMDIRFHVLNDFVEKFIVCESTYSHSGKKKELNFDINNYPKFKDKISYIVIDEEPPNIIGDKNGLAEPFEKRSDSLKRINLSYDYMIKSLSDVNENDLIILSDNDEIPNLNSKQFKNSKRDILIFKQLFFYYKFNLQYDLIPWFGSKAAKKKKLVSMSWLRNLKNKQYPFWRLDTLFSNNRYINLEIINDGGWHFSQLKKIDDIYSKLTNSEDHQEFKDTGKKISDIEDLVNRKVILYDHKAKSSDFKFGKEFKLETIGLEEMPDYIKKNKDQFKEWIDTTY